MTPQTVSIKHRTLVLGKHSSRHALKRRHSELGYELTQEELEAVYKLFTKIAGEKKEIFDVGLITILQDGLILSSNREILCHEKLETP